MNQANQKSASVTRSFLILREIGLIKIKKRPGYFL